MGPTDSLRHVEVGLPQFPKSPASEMADNRLRHRSGLETLLFFPIVSCTAPSPKIAL